MSKRPLKATDKRRNSGGHGVRSPENSESESGQASPLANLFNDRRKNLGHGKRAS